MNLFSPTTYPSPNNESFTKLLEHKNITIEQILSSSVNNGKWMQDAQDEWVVLLQGEATLQYETKDSQTLTAGDFTFIPAQTKHCVVSTSPQAIWLAIYIK